MDLKKAIEELADSHKLYKETCRCGRTVIVLDYHNDDPEYYHPIFIKCECGEFVKVLISIN